jgi:signal transduction histidine kinase
MGPGRGLWPIFLLMLAAVLVPTACVLWFMSQAVRNERIAVRQKLTDACRPQLERAARRVQARWPQEAAELSAAGGPPGEAFARLVGSGACDSAVICDRTGAVSYPVDPGQSVGPAKAEDPGWPTAAWLEFGRSEFAAAAAAYGGLAGGPSSDPSLAARALQAQARCLAKAGQREAAVEVLTVALDPASYHDARDPEGRFILPAAQLMALELMGGPGHPRYADTLRALAERLNDYSDPLLPSTQRRFLMRRLQATAPECPPLPALAAEELAADYLATGPSWTASSSLAPTALSDLWQLPASDGSAVALLRGERVADEARAVLAAELPLEAVSPEVLPPGPQEGEREPFMSVPAGDYLPGWRLALYLNGPDPFSAAAHRQVAAYFWTGFLVVAFTAVVAALVGRYVLRQVRLTRLRNDFIATVTHELKTPLASMRALVDTLREGSYRDAQQAAEYLQLIATENERLSRLIDNFLSFSRMERDKRAFELGPVQPALVASAAAEAVRARFESQGCRFEVELAPELPAILGDRDALVTVLLNLLDNAFKYSENERHIVLRAYAADGEVRFDVQDSGIGLSRRAIRKVFEPFYQVDRSLSRKAGGCGLGLSIVRFIVDAHGGSVDVKSQPGKGSTFTVRLPVTRVGG